MNELQVIYIPVIDDGGLVLQDVTTVNRDGESYYGWSEDKDGNEVRTRGVFKPFALVPLNIGR